MNALIIDLYNTLTIDGDFLHHKYNKQAFLEMFRTQLPASDISVTHSDEDADVDIISSP